MFLFRKGAFHVIATLLSGLVMTDPMAAENGAAAVHPNTMRASLFEELRDHRDIVMLGDSLTAQGEWAEFFPGTSIANRGISGDTTTGMLARLDPIIAMKPKVVFIMAGINDLGKRRDSPEIIATYQKIIGDLTEGGAKVVVQSTLYVSRRSRLSSNASITQINEELKAYCSSGNKCRFIDLNASMSAKGRLNGGYTGDGIHLNGKGYMAWVKAISETMTSYSALQSPAINSH